MQNSMVMFIFCVLDQDTLLGKFGTKINFVSLSWKLLPRLIWNFFYFESEISFLGKFGPKIKFVSLSWNLVPRLIRICVIQWRWSLFLFSTENILFGQIWTNKSKSFILSWNLVPWLIRICLIQWWCSLFPLWIRNILFGQIWSNKSKLSV